MTGRALPALLAAVLAALTLVAGCSGEDQAAGGVRPTASTTPAPPLGGPRLRPAAPPATPMDELERPIAARLADQVRRDGLTLSYLDCPDWNGRTPRRLTCTGYFDGVTGDVRVRLTSTDSGAVTFDATLADGLIATRSLVDRLERQGFTDARCGDTPAYPARVGLRVVCAVHHGGGRRLVVARVTDRSGEVDISRY